MRIKDALKKFNMDLMRKFMKVFVKYVHTKISTDIDNIVEKTLIALL